MHETTLYCFYDLAVSPASYDFFIYMQLAELHRKRHDFSNLFFVFVPGPKDGFRDDDLSKTIPQRYTMMRNVVIPSCQLLPSCEGVVWLQQRDQVNLFFERANGQVFPRNYTPQEPIEDYLWPGIIAAYLRNETCTMLQEPFEYTEMVDSLFPDSAKKIITVTIREAPYNTDRNMDHQAWQEFLETLDSSKYKIVIIPDTNNLSNDVFESFEYCKIASIDILFRIAIYRKAYLNMFHGNGTGIAASFSNSPLLMTQPVETDGASTIAWFNEVQAIDPNEHNQHAMWKKNQRLIWQRDKGEVVEDIFKHNQPIASEGNQRTWQGNTTEIIADAFEQYVEEFPKKTALPVEEHGFQSNHHTELACRVGLEYVIVKSFVQLQQEDIDTLKAIVNLMPYFIKPKHMLAAIAEKIGDFNTSIQLFDDCINLIGNVCSDSSKTDLYKKFRQSKAEVLEQANRFDDALYEYVEISKRYPDDNYFLEKISSLEQN
ncbi:TPA: hypothetical protein EYN98_11785 [Candidatus Poribacteria bacterium]|nr:hypothetical protein [Candidatus Poribacteria bacterium]